MFAAAVKTGAAILAAPVTGTLKRAAGDQTIAETVSRDNLWEAQTPQVFRQQLLIDAYARRGKEPATDDAQLVERLGHKVTMVPGSPMNIKITTKEDLRTGRGPAQGAAPAKAGRAGPSVCRRRYVALSSTSLSDFPKDPRCSGGWPRFSHCFVSRTCQATLRHQGRSVAAQVPGRAEEHAGHEEERPHPRPGHRLGPDPPLPDRRRAGPGRRRLPAQPRRPRRQAAPQGSRLRLPSSSGPT